MNNRLYHFTKSRKQRSQIFINMGVACLLYIAGLFGYEYYAMEVVDPSFKMWWIGSFSIAAIILFYIAFWHRKNPAVYEAIITEERFIIRYPESEQWSFDVAVKDIKRFEHRNTLSHAGSGIAKSGILMIDGSFHEICLNYGCSIGKMHESIQSIRPDVEFPKTINKKIEGPILSKDYDQ